MEGREWSDVCRKGVEVERRKGGNGWKEWKGLLNDCMEQSIPWTSHVRQMELESHYLFALSISSISHSSFLFYSLTLAIGCETNIAKLLKFNAACMRGFLRELHFQIRKVIDSADLFFNRLGRGGRFFLHCGAVENHFLFLITNFSGKTQLSFTTLL